MAGRVSCRNKSIWTKKYRVCSGNREHKLAGTRSPWKDLVRTNWKSGWNSSFCAGGGEGLGTNLIGG